MKTVEVTKLSSKGQVVIPFDVRKRLGVTNGAQFLVLTDGESVLLRPIDEPRFKSFESLIKESRRLARKNGFKKKDLQKIINRVRRESST